MNENTIETWKSAVPGRIWLKTSKDASKGTFGNVNVKGVDSILRIKTSDRLLNQENVRSPEFDPFINGRLVPVKAEQFDGPVFDDAKITEMLATRVGPKLRELLMDTPETVLKRIQDKIDQFDVTVSKKKMIDEVAHDRFAVHANLMDPNKDIKLGEVNPMTVHRTAVV